MTMFFPEEIESKALVLKGNFKDMSDVLRIARANGKRVFRCKSVRVFPEIHTTTDGVIVRVAPEEDGRRRF